MYTVLLLFLLYSPIILSDGVSYSWGYTKENGPDKWQGTCNDGIHQSPIDISGENVIVKHMPRLHFVKYNRKGQVEIINTGSSIMATGFTEWKEHRPYITGGHLQSKYNLVQWHIHWAQQNGNGSEHTIGMLHYPVEIHFVHVKDGLSVSEALKHPDGLAVVGAFFVVKNDIVNSYSFEDVELNVNSILEKNMNVTITSHRPRNLLPKSVDSFYRYEGSLTTPGCNEAVVWTVLDNPIVISQNQIDTLRKIKTVNFNNRPTQPLNGRKIYYRPHNIQSFLTDYIAQMPRSGISKTFPSNVFALISIIFSIFLKVLFY
ncbi:Alpha carbonic anhydrase domain-containing protein [Strongyloides ratti]|uniref:Carbonic anhydrase n=1 Tax=Strongyloides ratti TaxID=34506 RepID=A0A090KUC2_STRRB|nr:Alpha carbonic anhydrase domain-containing protein [Strongyloides ratti]CEF61100.1 Alpha carbonic anhydrase domain-containing protein [Strongyloides ratti]